MYFFASYDTSILSWIFSFFFSNTNLAIKLSCMEKCTETEISILFLQGQVVISLEDQERMRDKEQIRCLRKMLFGPHLNRGNVTQHITNKLNIILNPSLYHDYSFSFVVYKLTRQDGAQSYLTGRSYSQILVESQIHAISNKISHDNNSQYMRLQLLLICAQINYSTEKTDNLCTIF